MADASKKKTSGSFYSVPVALLASGKMGIGVKDLSHHILAVSMLKRSNGEPGPAEVAGLRLGDIIISVNFVPCRDGSKTLLHLVKQTVDSGSKIVTLQCWRCHQLCAEPLSASSMKEFIGKASDIIVQAYFLKRTNVFSVWEMWNFVEILLRHLNVETISSSDKDYSKMSKSDIPRHDENEAEDVNLMERLRNNSLLDLERFVFLQLLLFFK